MPITQGQALKQFKKQYRADPPYKKFTEEDRARLGARVPDIFIELASKHGWCSFNRQLLWLCDPDDWKGVAKPWLPSGSGNLLARTAFGDMVVSAGKKIWLILPHSATRIRLSDDPNWVVGVTLGDAGYEELAELPELVEAARAKVGELDRQQMYNYAPALALGGSGETSEVAKDDMKVALNIIRQLAPVTALDD
jgi:hypothetical protein